MLPTGVPNPRKFYASTNTIGGAQQESDYKAPNSMYTIQQ